MSNLLLDEKPLVILPELAVQVGLNEAIVLQQIHYWLKKEKIGKMHDGRKWVRNTYEEWQVNFPFWSESTVRRAINKLRDHGLVLVDRLNKKAYDKTNWYSIDYERLVKMTSGTAQNDQTDLSKMNRPIPETTSETTSDSSKGAQAPDPLPHNLNDWIQFVKDGQGQSGGMIARLGRMFATLYPDYEPDYGRIGTAAKRVRGAKRLAHLCWLSQGYRVTGDPVDYCEGMHKRDGGSNGRDRSTPQYDHNTPTPEELERDRRLLHEYKEKREAVS